MSRRIVIACIWWFSILAAIATAGCGPEVDPAQGPAASRGGQGDILYDGFRIRRDGARNRIWLLGLDDVRVYDGQMRLIRKIALPNWSVAGFACDPDMVLDGSGSAIVSSNAQARLWRIDAGTLEVREHPITLLGRERWDVGFATLVVGADGTLLALASVSESLWKIDLGNGSAQMVTPGAPLLSLCGLTMQSPGRAAGGADTNLRRKEK